MKDKWQRYALIVRAVGVLVIVALVALVGYYLNIFYSDKVGATSSKAVEAYFAALGEGDFDQVYALTTADSMYDIYGRPITRAEFIGQLKRLAGDEPLPLTATEVKKLFDKDGVRVYDVALHASVGSSPGRSRVMVQVHKTDNGWQLKYPFPIFLAVD